jgi:phosphoglycerate kinase
MGLNVGKSLVERDRIEMAKQLLERAGKKLVLPQGCVVAREMKAGVPSHAVSRDAIPADEAVLDIDPATSQDFAARITAARTIVWNGPMGVTEIPPFDAGTLAVARAMAEGTAKGATTVVGGGDSAAAVVAMGLQDSMSHVSTGGGASLEFLEGKTLPGVAALDDA